jgi:hypothetical protein
MDLSVYRMIAKRYRQRPYISIRPSTQGTAAVGDTIILREGEQYRVTRVSEPETIGRHIGDVTLDLEPIN